MRIYANQRGRSLTYEGNFAFIFMPIDVGEVLHHRHGDHSRLLLSCLGPLIVLLPKLKMI